MRTFKQKYRDRKGKLRDTKKWYTEFVDHNEITRRMPGFTDKRATDELGRRLESLAAVRMNGDTIPADLARWLQSTSNAIRDRIDKWGMLDSRTVANRKPLTEHLADFRQSLLDKGNTEDHANLQAARVRRIIEGCNIRFSTEMRGSTVHGHLAEMRKNDDTSARTSNGHLQAFKQFCRWMVKDGRAMESPVEHLTGINEKTDRRRERRNLPADELSNLLKTAASGPVRHKMTGRARAMLYRVAMETGFRRKELKSLRAIDVETESVPPVIIVHPTNTKNRKPVVQAIRPELAIELQRWIQDAGLASDSPLWPNLTRNTALMLRKDLEAAGIEYVDDAGLYADFHALRHSFISLLARGNVHPKLAQKLARHSDINLTMSRYSHTLLADETQALEALPEFPSVFDDNSPVRECQTLQATGTDDAGESVLPSGLPESVAFRGNPVHPDAVSDAERDATSIGGQYEENPLEIADSPQSSGVASGERGIRTPGPDFSEHRISNPAHSATLASLRGTHDIANAFARPDIGNDDLVPENEAEIATHTGAHKIEDPVLAEVVEAWPRLTAEKRSRILAIVSGQ